MIAERQKPPPGALYLDHVGHFVPELGAAAALAQSLGFAVTPESAHVAQGRPAGTSNRCIMLEAGYLEILSPVLDTPQAARVRSIMSRRTGEPAGGVHLACFGTPAAEAEHRRLADHGFEPEPLVALERETPHGRVRFRVVYVPPGKMPEGRIQYVEQITPEVIWHPGALGHTNGVRGLAEVYVVADDPAGTAARWAQFTGLLPGPDGPLVRLQAERGAVVVGTQESLARLLGEAPAAPGLAGYGLACSDPAGFLARCRSAGLAVSGDAVRLPPALGGAWRLLPAG